jgi:hypothetical protein
MAQLVDGVYREKYLPDSATETIIRLSQGVEVELEKARAALRQSDE